MESTHNSDVNEKCLKLLEQLYSSENEQPDFCATSQLLADFRILTREKTLNSEVLNKRCISALVDHSKECHTEAQKCLSNLILNYAHLRDQLIEPYVKCVETRLTTILTDQSSQHRQESTKQQENSGEKLCEVLYYDLRIIFLLSALCSSSRDKIRDRLVELILKFTEREADKFSHRNYLLVVESLKTLFNLTLDKCLNQTLAGDVIKKLFLIVGTEKDMIKSNDAEANLDTTDQLLVSLIHLLTNMPAEVYNRLSNQDVDKVLNHLDYQLKTYSKDNFRDTVLPVLNVCANICKYNEEVRIRWFDEIVGSVTEFEKRPEEYDNLRGRLVKLMTSVDVHMKEIAAEFLHALCGGDTAKLVTYTGFGNSAAFLSSRGLLGQGSRGHEDVSQGQAGDGIGIRHEDLRDKIDLITGKLATPKSDPMEGMSEEEKEYHACELADAITKLNNLGVVKPMEVDQDGNLSELCPSSSESKKE